MKLGKTAHIAADFMAWAAVHAATGYLAHRLPDRCYQGDRWLWRARPWEDDRFYVDRLRIRRWKRLLPDAGGWGWVSWGFAKRRLAERSPDYLATFSLETRRAELGHWLALLAGPGFALWNPPRAMVWLQLYALASNLPCIVTQRYNRLRLERVTARRGPEGQYRPRKMAPR